MLHVDVKKLQAILEKNGVKLHRTKAMEGNVPVPRKPGGPRPAISKMYVHNDPEEVRQAGSGH